MNTNTGEIVLSVGDVIYVKTDLDKSLSPKFISAMESMLGKPVTITRVIKGSNGSIFYRIKESGYSWINEWFDLSEYEQRGSYEFW